MHIINNADVGMTHTKPLIPDAPFHPGLIYRPPSKPIRSNVPRSQGSSQSSSNVENIIPDIILDFEENSPFQEGVISIMTGQDILSRPKRIKQSQKHS